MEQQGWDIDYSRGTVENIWGTAYNVDIQSSERCLQLPGLTYPTEQKIILREPCESKTHTSVEEGMAYTLAHEVGHADTWGISAVLPYIVLSLGIAQAVKQKSFKPMKTAALGVVGCKVLVDELLAETAASVFHGVPFMKDVYVCLPDLEGILRQIGH